VRAICAELIVNRLNIVTSRRSYGLPVDYNSSRNALSQTLEALTNGGPVILNPGKPESVYVPSAATEEIQAWRLRLHSGLTTAENEVIRRFRSLSPADQKALIEFLKQL
jgi:hypothetical protein